MIDSTGLHGLILHYALLFSLFTGALVAFIYALVSGSLRRNKSVETQPFHEEHDE